MTLSNLNNKRYFYFTNLPGYATEWTMVNGEMVGKVYRTSGADAFFYKEMGGTGEMLTSVVTFPISK